MRLAEGSTGDGPDPFPGWGPPSRGSCCLQDEARWVFPSPDFPGEVLGLKPQEGTGGCPARPTPAARELGTETSEEQETRATLSALAAGSDGGHLVAPRCGG